MFGFTRKIIISLFVFIQLFVGINVYADQIKHHTIRQIVHIMEDLNETLCKDDEDRFRMLGESGKKFIEEYYNFNAHVSYLEDGNKGQSALFDPESNTIMFKRTLSRDGLLVMLVHELTHYQQKVTRIMGANNIDAILYANIRYSDHSNIHLEMEAFKNAMRFYKKYILKDAEVETIYKRKIASNQKWLTTLAMYDATRNNGKDIEFLESLYN